MKILFVYINIGQRRFYPIGLTMLVNELVSQNHDVKIFDTSFYENIGGDIDKKRQSLGFYKNIENEIAIQFKTTSLLEDLSKIIHEFKPRLVGISALSVHYTLSKYIAESVKEIKSDIPIILGGIHATVVPEECIQEKYFDMICLGEGEEAIVDLAKCIESGEDFSNIENLWVKNNGTVTRNKVRSFKILDDLPKPNWDLFDPQHIWGGLYGKMYRMAPIELSRGCPYRCTYCVNDKLREVYSDYTRYHRRKSPEKAIEDMLYLKSKFDIEMFYILDETFMSMPKEYMNSLSKLYIEKIGIPFFSQTRPESVTEEKVKIISDMGCKVISMGIENGNENLRKEILNRNVSNEQIIRAFEILRKYGIKASSFNMLGVPGETKETILETIALNRLCKPDSIGVSYFFPYKGTSLRKLAIEKKMMNGDEDPALSNDQPVLNLPTISKEDIIFYYENFVEYCRNKEKAFENV